jgi:hypothetical protein
MSALLLARGIAERPAVRVIDTENGRAKHYADDFPSSSTASSHAPFALRYAEAIEAAEKAGYPVIVVDSTSHEHVRRRRLLDMHDELERMGGDQKKNREDGRVDQAEEGAQEDRDAAAATERARDPLLPRRTEGRSGPRKRQTEIVPKASLTD